MLKNLDHPNIMRTFNLIYDDKKLNLITELFEGGDLFEKLEAEGAFSEQQASIYFKQILNAMTYSHKRHVVHRDLKPENIMFKTKSPGSPITILDYGAANVFHLDASLTKHNGTPYYMAPEVVMGDHDEKSDVWSAGIILYIMLTECIPFDGDTDNEIFDSIIEDDL
jgi:calcium-dependent protein kinase